MFQFSISIVFVCLSCLSTVPVLSSPLKCPFLLSSACMRMYDKQKSPSYGPGCWGIGHPMSPFELKVSDRVDAVLATLHSTLSLGLGYVSSTPGQGTSGLVRVPSTTGSKILSCIGAKILSSKLDRRGFRYCKTCCTPRSCPSIFAVARPAGAMCLEWTLQVHFEYICHVCHVYLRHGLRLHFFEPSSHVQDVAQFYIHTYMYIRYITLHHHFQRTWARISCGRRSAKIDWRMCHGCMFFLVALRHPESPVSAAMDGNNVVGHSWNFCLEVGSHQL